MAKRRSNNRRSSRYNRSSVGSGLLDPNSGILNEEEPFWWNHLSNNSTTKLEKYDTANETSPHLNSKSQVNLSNVTHEWWKELDSSGEENSESPSPVKGDKQSVITNPILESTKMTVSDVDKESSLLTVQKKKIRIRGKSKRSKSNAFLKALNDSKDSESSSSEQEVIVSNPTNDKFTPTSEKLKVPDSMENRMSKRRSNNVATSSDTSPITDKILKSKPKVFGKRYKETRENVFEDALKSVEDTTDITEKSKIIHKSSLHKSIERGNSSDENIVDKSERRVPQVQSSIKNSTQFIINAEKSQNDDNYLFRDRTDSSFEIQSDNKDSPEQQNSFTKKRHSSSIKSPDVSKRIINSPANKKTLESSQIKISKPDDKSERSLGSLGIFSKISERSTHPEINRSKRSIDVVPRGNINEEGLINEINDEDIQETSGAEKNLSYFKRRRLNLLQRINDNENINDPYQSNDRINNSIHDVTTDFLYEDLSYVGHASTSGNQMNRVTSHNSIILRENNIENISKNERKMSIRSISTSSEESCPNYNEKTQSRELDISISTLKQKSDKVMDNTVVYDNDEILQQKDQLHEKTINSINASLKKKVDRDKSLQPRDQLHEKTTNSINTSIQKNIDNDQNLQQKNPLHNRFVNSVNISRQKNIHDDHNLQQKDQLHEKTTNSINTSLKKKIDRDQSLLSRDQLHEKTTNSINTSIQKNIDNDQNIQQTNIHDDQNLENRDQLPDKTLNFLNTSQKKKIDDDRNLQDKDRLRDKTVHSVNSSHKKKINDYFTATTSKLVSPIKTKQSTDINLLKKIKEDKEIKARLKEKMKVGGSQKITDKEIGSLLAKITAGNESDIKERIKKLQNIETKKQPKEKKINKAYIVNGKVYKRPKLPRPQPWATDRLYNHLRKIMEPKYKLLTRVKSEEFVLKLSGVVTTVIKSKKYADYENLLNDLMIQMARLGIISTRNDFYIFCHEFLPYDFRIKVVPMIVPGNVRNIPYDPEKLHETLLEE